MDFKQAADVVGTGFQVVGIAVLVIGAILAFVMYLKAFPRRRDTPTAYSDLRRDLGKIILVGLELLVAADIIRSVAIDPTFATVGVLGLIVLIRTFLSWSLEVEVNGRWPWQSSRSPNEDSSCG
jgi:uncharacterized membrane protein